jgi:hypothetical protein
MYMRDIKRKYNKTERKDLNWIHAVQERALLAGGKEHLGP